jgi:molecular chaperone Hsp31 and glyoxalase 3
MGAFLSRIFGLDPIPEKDGEGYEPSSFSRMLAIDSKTDYKPVNFGKTYQGNKKVLVVCTEEKYMTMENGKKFASGNHPVETCQPIMHLINAGFAIDVATPTGKPAALELWALPKKDKDFLDFFESQKSKFENPLSLADIVKGTDKHKYVAVFAPGGQGAMLGLPFDESMASMIKYIKEKDLYFMSVCHGPAVLLSVKDKPHPYDGYKIACFPDAIDKQTPMLGYLPGVQTWYFGEKLVADCGITIVNTGADATFVADRKLLTGASPKACQELGVTAAQKLLEEFA